MKTKLRNIFKYIWRTVFFSIKVLLAFSIVTAIAATIIIKTSGDPEFSLNLPKENIVNDITGLNPIHVNKVIKPTTTQEIIAAITESSGPISIGGGRFSMGGQTAYEDSLHIDMRDFDEVINLDVESKRITVQPGITWREVQQAIDPKNLSVRIMQTYANFTVGGSLSVNVHGRYIGEGPLIKSVEGIKIILASGEEITANRNENSEIFYAAIGGYGGIGVITEATLNLADNVKIERKTKKIKSKDYPEYFKNNIRNNKNVVFHNGDLYPPEYEEVMDVSWYKTEKDVTEKDRLIKEGEEYSWGPKTVEFVADYDIGKSIRKNIIDPLYYSIDRVVWRNWEASYDVAELEPDSRSEYTYVLREYFVPVQNFSKFVPKMKKIFNDNNVNIINVSIRHAHAAPENYLSWARDEVFAFVVYFRQGTDDTSKEAVKKWSKEMIDAAIESGGTYYLPYQIFASSQQFNKAYPNADKFFEVKKKVDPDYRFRNVLWKHHYPSTEQKIVQKKLRLKDYYRNENQSILTVPEWYLVFNPLEYATFLKKGNNPSDFPFMKSINEYWTLYDRAVAINKNYGIENTEYMTMLKVIGISTTVEYMYKALYENTLGRFTRWTANGQDTPEDKIIADAQAAYSDLIFDEAWYKFGFSKWIKKIWGDTSFFGKNFIRKTERKMFFTLEFGFKTVYAKLIGFGAQTAFEQSDGFVHLTASYNESELGDLPDNVTVRLDDGQDHILSIPRWGDFTKTLPVVLDQGAKITDISGNRNIVLSFTRSIEDEHEYNTALKLFESAFVSDGKRVRDVVMVRVDRLNDLLQEVSQENITLEHIYDF